VNQEFSYVLEGTLAMVLLTLIITHSGPFSKVISTTGQVLVGGVQALWATGRKDS
jgi:hypothetical protein